MALGKNIKKEIKPKQEKFKVKSWYANRYQFVLVQRNILLIFALLSAISVSFGMIFLNHVISSKSLEPYIIEIEEKSGIPIVVDQLSVEELTGNELMVKYFLNQFIDVANHYNPNTYLDDIERVRVLSSPGVLEAVRARINPRQLGTDMQISVQIKSIQFPSPNNATIRIQTTMNDGSGTAKETNEIVNLTYYIDPSIQLTQKERLINPLGFQVTGYGVMEEIVDY